MWVAQRDIHKVLRHDTANTCLHVLGEDEFPQGQRMLCSPVEKRGCLLREGVDRPESPHHPERLVYCSFSFALGTCWDRIRISGLETRTSSNCHQPRASTLLIFPRLRPRTGRNPCLAPVTRQVSVVTNPHWFQGIRTQGADPYLEGYPTISVYK